MSLASTSLVVYILLLFIPPLTAILTAMLFREPRRLCFLSTDAFSAYPMSDSIGFLYP